MGQQRKHAIVLAFGVTTLFVLGWLGLTGALTTPLTGPQRSGDPDVAATAPPQRPPSDEGVSRSDDVDPPDTVARPAPRWSDDDDDHSDDRDRHHHDDDDEDD